MKATLRNMVLTALIGISPMVLAGNGTRYSTTVVGHMSVTLLTPAAITQNQAMQFTSKASASGSFDATKGKIQIHGNNSTYAVTVENASTSFSQNGKNISIEDFSATTNLSDNGTNNILLDGNIRVVDNIAMNNTQASPLSVTINYN
jgi:hypothetical protein